MYAEFCGCENMATRGEVMLAFLLRRILVRAEKGSYRKYTLPFLLLQFSAKRLLACCRHNCSSWATPEEASIWLMEINWFISDQREYSHFFKHRTFMHVSWTVREVNSIFWVSKYMYKVKFASYGSADCIERAHVIFTNTCKWRSFLILNKLKMLFAYQSWDNFLNLDFNKGIQVSVTM